MAIKALLHRFFGRGAIKTRRPHAMLRREDPFVTPPQGRATLAQQQDPLDGISWVAMTCFVEGIEPRTLSLSEPVLHCVQRDIARLHAMQPLEAYARCLEYLSERGAPTQCEDEESVEEESSAKDCE